ncbi:MAG TPA: AAA family ATPase, partial [Pirellulales bacterium]|nr:AAA family ATPase [Pirellulales bacterium]
VALTAGAMLGTDEGALRGDSRGTSLPGSLPAVRPLPLEGIHAYADRASAAAGETVRFYVSATHPYEFQVCRLAGDVDGPGADAVLFTQRVDEPVMQPIHPGSYIHIDRGLGDEAIAAVSLECWLRLSIAMDLFISMATGTPFLGQFKVPKAVPCGLMTSESGAASIIAIARRITAAKGLDTSMGPDLTTLRARMTDDRHLDLMERNIEKYGWKCVGIDPTYLAFADVGDSASNVFKMGKALEPVTTLIQRTGCAIILLNHNIKGRAKDVGRFDPPDLAEISMSGFAEWMRFWILLAQTQDWDEETGQHCLWMRTGGSAGHAGLHGLHVTEGELDAKGRRTKWEAKLQHVNDTRRERENRKENNKAKQRERTEEDHVRKLRDAMNLCDGFESGRKLRRLSGLNPSNFGGAIRTLLKRGEVEQEEINKKGNPCDGYRLKGKGGPTRNNVDQQADQNT